MGDSIKYYQDHDLEESKEEVLNKEVENILGLYRLLSLEDKLKAKKAEADDIGSRVIPELLAEQGLSEIKLYIFDRWGKQIFYTDQLNKGWDGTYLSSESVQQDTYVYKIIAIDINDKKHLKEGHVNLVK